MITFLCLHNFLFFLKLTTASFSFSSSFFFVFLRLRIQFFRNPLCPLLLTITGCLIFICFSFLYITGPSSTPHSKLLIVKTSNIPLNTKISIPCFFSQEALLAELSALHPSDVRPAEQTASQDFPSLSSSVSPGLSLFCIICLSLFWFSLFWWSSISSSLLYKGWLGRNIFLHCVSLKMFLYPGCILDKQLAEYRILAWK